MKPDQLTAVFRFDESDLIANQAGVLSVAQRQRHASQSRLAKVFLLGAALLCFCGAAWVMSAAFHYRSAGDELWALLLAGVAAFALPGLFALARAVRPQTQLSAVRVSGVARVTRVQRRSSSSTGPRYFTATELWLGETQFDVPSEAFPLIKDGQPMTVFHLNTNRHQILSIEVNAAG